jgi:DNA-binding transcriptional ArsR family regulator
MLGFSYNVNENLLETLEKIEAVRLELLLIPIPPKAEIRLSWEAKLNKIYWLIFSEDSSVTKNKITGILKSYKKGILSKEEKEIVNLKKTIDYTLFQYTGLGKEVTVADVLEIYRMLGGSGRLHVLEDVISQFLKYLHVKKEHVILQSGIAQIQLLRIRPFTKNNHIISSLIASLFLYKEGYGFRGLFVPEEQWNDNSAEYKKIFESTKEGNLTLWLEYFAEGMLSELHKLKKKISTLHFQTEIPAVYFELTDRQREILSLLDNPDVQLTNRMVQQNFKVSQITASRDLAKLSELNLIYSRGKGRSVYYNREI